MLQKFRIYLSKKLSDLSRWLCGKKAGTTIIEIERLTEPQKIALEDMLATWEYLGGIGSSRWTAFFADGDGNFRPKIKIDGNKPKQTDLVTEKQKWENEIIGKDYYMIDFDWIAWALHKD